MIRILAAREGLKTDKCGCVMSARDMYAPRHFWGATLENYVPTSPQQGGALSDVRTFIEQFKMGEWKPLVLIGNVGRGKTHLAVATAWKLAHRTGVQPLFTGTLEYLERLKSTYEPDAPSSEFAAVSDLQTAELLILDDLGVERMTEWATQELARLIDTRYDDCLPVIVTTNFPLETLGQRLARMNPLCGEVLGDRIASRLGENARWIVVEGEDWRMRSREND